MKVCLCKCQDTIFLDRELDVVAEKVNVGGTLIDAYIKLKIHIE